MKVLAALLLTVLLCAAVSSVDSKVDSTQTLDTTASHKYDVYTPTEPSQNSLHEANSESDGEPYATASSGNEQVKEKASVPDGKGETSKWKKEDDLLLLKPFLNPKDMLLQEIHTLNEEASDAKVIYKFLYLFILYLLTRSVKPLPLLLHLITALTANIILLITKHGFLCLNISNKY